MTTHAWTTPPKLRASISAAIPNPYCLDLRWQIIWLYLTYKLSPCRIAPLLHVSERTVRKYMTLFYQSWPGIPKNRPQGLFGDFEQLTIPRLILANPGIYLHKLQDEFVNTFGVSVSKATICRTLRFMGCTRQAMHHIAIQQSEVCRGRLMAEISIYDPSMLVCWIKLAVMATTPYKSMGTA